MWNMEITISYQMIVVLMIGALMIMLMAWLLSEEDYEAALWIFALGSISMPILALLMN